MSYLFVIFDVVRLLYTVWRSDVYKIDKCQANEQVLIWIKLN